MAIGSSKASPAASEAVTRKLLIDGRLNAAGWKVVLFSPGAALPRYGRCAVAEFETEKGPADYALCADGKIVGIVEAKKLTLGPQNVLTQALRYSKGLEPRAPFLYSTNGEVIWHQDIRHDLNRSRQVAGFHTPAALAERLERDFDGAVEQLQATPNVHPKLRPYQREANEAIERALADRKRLMLVAMATGTLARGLPPTESESRRSAGKPGNGPFQISMASTVSRLNLIVVRGLIGLVCTPHSLRSNDRSCTSWSMLP